MSAHWHAEHAKIFTAVVYYSKLLFTHKSYAVVSDDLQHDKGFVLSANHTIFNDLQNKLLLPIQYTHNWSDGVGSQFKS